jgi:hypothetical protein
MAYFTTLKTKHTSYAPYIVCLLKYSELLFVFHKDGWLRYKFMKPKTFLCKQGIIHKPNQNETFFNYAVHWHNTHTRHYISEACTSTITFFIKQFRPEIWGFNGGEDSYCGLLGYGTVKYGSRVPTLRRNILSPFYQYTRSHKCSTRIWEFRSFPQYYWHP